jgi:hypothetical protein
MKRLVAVAGISMAIFGVAASVAAAEIPSVSLYSGYGMTLNFRAANEKVQRVWLDDPSQVTVDFDDVGCRSQEQSCAAQVIHLRRIKRLKFDDLPLTSTTALTVVTDKSIHQFQLTFPSSGKPNSMVINITADVKLKPRSSRRPDL